MRLTATQWTEIKTRFQLGESINSIAMDYGVPESTVRARKTKESWTQELRTQVIDVKDKINVIANLCEPSQLPLIQAKLNETVDLMGIFQSFVKLAANLNVQVLQELSTEPDLKTRIIGLNSLKATFKDIADITRTPPVNAQAEDKDETIKIEFIRK